MVAEIGSAVATGMAVAGKALSASTARNINTPYPPASEPGTPPHRRSGDLHDAVTHSVRRGMGTVVLRVGVPPGGPVYAAFLQGGTRRMAPRPFIPTPELVAATVRGYVTAAIKGAG